VTSFLCFNPKEIGVAYKTQKGKFIELPEDFTASVHSVKGKRIEVEASGVYVTWDYSTVWLNYAGDDAQKSYTTFELPSDGDFLRHMASKLVELADELYPEK